MTDRETELPELPVAMHTAGYLHGSPKLYDEATLIEYGLAAVLADRERAQAECEALRKDAGRLDFLDARNRPLKMGWSVSDAPAGNVSIMSMNVSIISIMSIGGREPTSIRSAIDAAMAKEAQQ